MKPSIVVLAGFAVALLAAAGFTGTVAQQSTRTSAAVKFGEPFTPLPALRIKPLESSKWTDKHRELLGPPNTGMTAICAHNLEICAKWWAFGRTISERPTIPVRDREILILRTAYLCNSDFVWHNHSDRPSRGLTIAEAERVAEGPEAKGWTPFEATLIRATDELHRSQFIKDATWKALAEKYNDGQMVEVIFTVGDYHIYAMYHNSVGLQLPAGGRRAPR